jgi:3-oxoacyl-(acyl-carrier-protein) synthase/NADP-dependent 3-hydroxy acid dehydrogenase YdfG
MEPVSDANLLQTVAQLLADALRTVGAGARTADDRNAPPLGSVVVTGCGLGLPGAEKPVMDPRNVERVLRGEQFVDLVPERFREQIAQRHVVQTLEDDPGARSATFDDTRSVIKLAGRPGSFDLTTEYGVPQSLVATLDTTTQLAMAAGLDALCEAGIPLVPTFRRTATGELMPDRWLLPETMRDETGVIFVSAFPGLDRFAAEAEHFYTYRERLARRALLEDLRRHARDDDVLREIQRHVVEVESQLGREPYSLDRRFLLRVLPMGHSQFAEYIGARGPNTHINAAWAGTAQAIGIAEDWIRSGRCCRVIVIGADNVTSEQLLGWIGAGFLAIGAAATDDKVSDVALPFDRRRHGTILGMGSCGLVVESQDAVEERGMRASVELLASEVRNSAYDATQPDTGHVAMVVESTVASAERRFGLTRQQIAPALAFVSHEEFAPARTGVAAAEVAALRRVFGEAVNEIVITNTKVLTGHTMGVGIEDVVAVKILEHGIVPPVPNVQEIDPALAPLTVSRGGRYPVKYALHVAAGLGSQVSATLFRRIPGGLDRIDDKPLYRKWLADVTGYETAESEVITRVLRVRSKGPPTRPVGSGRWRFGRGPACRASSVSEHETRLELVVSHQTAVPEAPAAVAADATPAPPGESSVVRQPDRAVPTAFTAADAEAARGRAMAAGETPVRASPPSPLLPASLVHGPASEARRIPFDRANHVPRRVAAPALRPPLAFCKATGVVLDERSRIIVAMDEHGVAPRLEALLADQGATVLALPVADEEQVVLHLLEGWLADGPVQGLYWLPALDIEPPLAALEIGLFRRLLRRRVKHLANVMRVLYQQMDEPGRFLVAATRMGGLHGYGPDGATAPLGGAVAGFVKAYKRERSAALVKVVDFAPLTAASGIAQWLIDETLSDGGVIEVGYRDGLRWTVTLDERPAADGAAGLRLDKDTIFVVTGATGALTSAVVSDLANASGGTFYLLDAAPRPDAADPRLDLIRRDREGLKARLVSEAKLRGEQPTPMSVDRQMLGLDRSRAMLDAIEAVGAAGGMAHYRTVALTDAAALGAVLGEIREHHGRIDVLLHAVGAEVTTTLVDKTPADFDRLLDVKAEGFFQLLKGAHDLPIGATVVFSSVAGRFGRAGQADSASANAYLCSMSRHLRFVRSGIRAIAIDWNSVGDAAASTRAGSPRSAERPAYDAVPFDVCVPTVRRELTAGGTADEIVVSASIEALAAEWDETGGLDSEKVKAWLAATGRPQVMVGWVSAAPLYGSVKCEILLDPEQHPFLYDHRIEDVPVLPAVMGTEAFAELALLLAPDWVIDAVEHLEFLLPFKFFRMAPATLHFSLDGRPAPSGDLLVEVVLRSRVQPRPEVPIQERVHFRGRVRLAREHRSPPPAKLAPSGGRRITNHDIYSVYFHGPAYRVLSNVRLIDTTAIGEMAEHLPPDTAPAGLSMMMAPRLIELVFQTAGILEIARRGSRGLPAAVRSVTTYRGPETAGGRRLYAVVLPSATADEYEGYVVDDTGNVYVEVQGYRTVALPGRIAPDTLSGSDPTPRIH